MDKTIFDHSHAPLTVVHNLVTRDAALWVGSGFDQHAHWQDALARLMRLPWRLVLCETSDAGLVDRLHQKSERFERRRGFLHVVASDPESASLPRQALPVYLLNGRDDSTDKRESPTLSGNARMRRRLNMINRLIEAKPRQLVALVSADAQPLDDIADLWTDDFSAQVAVIDPSASQRDRLTGWLREPHAPPAVDYAAIDTALLVDELSDALEAEAPDDRIVVRVQDVRDAARDVDVTDCDLVEQPLLDRYEIIQSRHLRPLQPEELPEEELVGFFDRSRQSWLPFAAGVPWPRSAAARDLCLKALREATAKGVDFNRVLVLASESGAGGTTFARYLAYESARAGFVTLVAKPAVFRPDATPLASFLHRLQQSVRLSAQSHPKDGRSDEAPERAVLIVFDVQHWLGREGELRTFATELVRSGRSAVVLYVTPARVHEDLANSSRVQLVDTLFHHLDRDEALALGRHLNQFLKHKQRDRTEEQWLAFWESTRPGPQFATTSFWVALDFWLKRQFDLGESIQTWLYRQFKGAVVSDTFRTLLLEIAALSIERIGLPETLLPPTPAGEFPFSVQLEHTRESVPGLALVRAVTASERQWATAHDILARYLLTATYFDREMLERLSLSHVRDPIDLRLHALRRIATRGAIAQEQHLPLAIDFAVTILKLDRSGNQEFHRSWKEVLQILEDMPDAIWNTSRTFNHHVAVSRRRVATDSVMFELSPEERKQQLELAVEHLTYALTQIQPKAGDESDLNLINSLARAYQNLAEVEDEIGAAPERVKELRHLATEAARKAQQENPNNSFVLETLARDLLDNGERDHDIVVQNSCEALSYIFQAAMLENSELRQSQLSSLTHRALKALNAGDAEAEIEMLCKRGNPLGHVARAWRILGEDAVGLDSLNLAAIDPTRVSRALEELDHVTSFDTWLPLRFRYDLVSLSQPMAFEEQLRILEALEGTGFRLPLQLAVEKAILLHQAGRHHHANLEFRQLRRLLRESDAIVRVPNRLRWLYAPQQPRQLICDAQVVEPSGYRLMARVRDLQNTVAPLIPHDFGPPEAMTPGYRFKCAVTFGPMGPFLKPPSVEDGS